MDQLNQDLAQKKKEWAELRKRLIPKKMNELDINQYQYTDELILRLRTDMSCIVAKGKMSELCEWLKKNSHGDLVLTQVDIKKFKHFMYELILLEKELPPEELVACIPYQYGKITKGKPT